MSNHIKIATKTTLFVIGFVLTSYMVTGVAHSLDVPQLKGRVNDYGNILSATARSQLELILSNLEQTDSTQLVVLTIASLEKESLEGFSLRVVENWKIGQTGFDNGVLLLVAVGDRKVRIEVGYGLEGTLTDLRAGRIIHNEILPRFKRGDFDKGVIDGVNAIIQTVKGEYTSSQDATTKKRGDAFGLLPILLFIAFFFSNVFGANKLVSALAGGAITPLIGTLFLGFSLPLALGLIPFGIVFGLTASRFHKVSSRSGRIRNSSHSSMGGFGGFGSSFGGGFSGGGGGFGGGGASGGW